MTRVISLVLDANPLTTVVISESLAATNSEAVAALRNEGASVFTYPLSVQLTKVLELPGALRFAVTGPPGNYTILTSTDLAEWTAFGTVSNPLGSILFTDVTAHLSPEKFYRALLQSPPAPAVQTNLVFISPNTFTPGSPNDGLQGLKNQGTSEMLTVSFDSPRFPTTHLMGIDTR